MPSILSIQDIITTARLALCFCVTDTKKQQYQNVPSLDPNLPLLIAMETDFLSWAYDANPNDTSLRKVANYLVKICGKYFLQASENISLGGLVSNPNPASAFYLEPKRIEFIVGTSYINDGETSLIITDNVFDGFLDITYNSGVVPRNTTTTADFYYTPTFGVDTTVITFSQPVTDLSIGTIDYYKIIQK